MTSQGTRGLWSPPSHFESTWLENSDFVFADFHDKSRLTKHLRNDGDGDGRHVVQLATWCWLPAPLAGALALLPNHKRDKQGNLQFALGSQGLGSAKAEAFFCRFTHFPMVMGIS